MTVIAIKNEFIVADQRITNSDRTVYGTTEKIISTITEGYGLYVGICGDCGLEDEINSYIINDLIFKQHNENTQKIKDKLYAADEKMPQACALAVLKNTQTGQVDVYSYDSKLLRCKANAPFYAEGHGACLALGAMASGTSAWEAVHVAIRFDTTCGYPIHGYDIRNGRHYVYEDESQFRHAHKSPTEAVQRHLNLSGIPLADFKPGAVHKVPRTTGQLQPVMNYPVYDDMLKF